MMEETDDMLLARTRSVSGNLRVIKIMLEGTRVVESVAFGSKQERRKLMETLQRKWHPILNGSKWYFDLQIDSYTCGEIIKQAA